jgi:hypothetical protein
MHKQNAADKKIGARIYHAAKSLPISTAISEKSI